MVVYHGLEHVILKVTDILVMAKENQENIFLLIGLPGNSPMVVRFQMVLK